MSPWAHRRANAALLISERMSAVSSHSDVILHESIYVYASLNGECCGIPLLFGDEGEHGWDWRPHLSWSLCGVTLSGDRMSVVSRLAASSSSVLSPVRLRGGAAAGLRPPRSPLLDLTEVRGSFSRRGFYRPLSNL